MPAAHDGHARSAFPFAAELLEHVGMTSRAADLLLRGTARLVRARVEWHERPAAASPLVVLLTAPGCTCCREHCLRAGAIVLTPQAPIWEAAVEALEWAADHAGELGADPGRLIVAGEGRGAALAARLALRARDHGWPQLERQLLVRPELDAPEVHPSPAGAAPATVVLGGDAHWYVDWMRRAGVEVEELHVRHDQEKGTVTTTLKRFTIVRWIDAPPERVFDTWLDRGRLRARLGRAPIAFRDVTRPERLVFTTAGSEADPDAPVAILRLSPIAGGTKLHLHACVPDDDNTDDRWSALAASSGSNSPSIPVREIEQDNRDEPSAGEETP
jgi:alpha/beta hydrolase fold